MTTHSPYILSSLNNLIYAYKVGQNHKEEVQNIVDEELQQIKAERLDQVSTVLNEEFDRLLDIEENI